MRLVPQTTRQRRRALIALASVLLAACSGGEQAVPAKTTIDMGTAPAGEMPGPVADITDPPAPLDVPEAPPDVGIGQVAPFAKNNRVLLIGDFVFEVSSGNNLACSILNPLGWAVELDAVGKATLGFGAEAVDARMEAGDFGVVGIMLGNNLDSSAEEFAKQYRSLIEEIGPRPILAYTPAFTEENLEILDAIRIIADETPNVRIVDWGYSTQEKPAEMVGPSGFPTAEGANKLWQLTSDALGQWGKADGQDPAAEANCLPETYNSSTYTGPSQVP